MIQPVNVTINALPSVVATNDGPICSGSSFILNENGGNAVSWMWTTTGTAIINTNTDQSPVVTGATNGDQFIVVVIDINGCTNSANTIILVVLSPILDPIADVFACDSYDLPVITGTNLTGNEAYYDDSQANGGVPLTGPITSSQLVWVYDANGICSSNTNFNVTINPTPNLLITDPAAVCSPNTVDITASTVTAGSDPGTLTYWTDASAISPLTTSLAVATTGTYYIQLDLGGGCIVIMPVNVTVNLSPTLISFTGSDSYCSGDSISDVFVDVSGTPVWTIDYTLDGVLVTIPLK